MSFNHEAVAALPVGSAADKALLRAMATRRMAYCLGSSESAASFTAVDPDAGTLPLFIIQNALLFQLDPVDTTTAPDSVTCLVTADNKRYKTTTLNYPWSVLTRRTIAEPVSPPPSVGDRYLIPTAATGTDWAGKDGQVGIFTAAGWFFAVVPIGRFLYVEDETAFYHRNAAGNWTAGVGSLVLSAGAVTLPNVLGAKASFVVKVENQTTNAPPASPVTPTAYIIGPSPTGAWSGLAGQLAICLAAGSFTVIAPVAGDEVYDKARNAVFRFNGTAWLPAAGPIIDTISNIYAGTASFGGSYSANNNIPQITGGHWITQPNVHNEVDHQQASNPIHRELQQQFHERRYHSGDFPEFQRQRDRCERCAVCDQRVAGAHGSVS